MTDLTDRFESQALEVKQDNLSDISSLAKEALCLETKIKQAEEGLKRLQKAHKDITENRIPSAMQEVGMSKIAMQDGSTIEVKPFYSASIPSDKKAEAFDWLRKQGFDDIIKNIVSVQFGRGEDDDARQCAQVLREKLGMIPLQVQKIEPQTLKAWVKERVEKGDEFPTELFGAFCGTQAKIKSKN